MNLIKQIDFRKPKYVLPAILYPLILGTGWLVIDMFKTEVKDVPDKNLEETEYLNPTLPQAQIRDDGIGNRTESMIKSYGRIQDYSAVENIDRENEDQTEDYNSRYSDEDFAMLDREAQDRTEELLRLREMQDRVAEGAAKGNAMASDTVSPATDTGVDNQEVLAELERALAEARLKGQQSVADARPAIEEKVTATVTGTETVETKEGAVTQPSEDAEAQTVVKAKRPSSSYFNTLAENEPAPSLIKAIIDEDIKAVDGSRVRLRLLDDIEINDVFLPKGSYLYATMSGFSQQRVKGNIKSLMAGDELVRVNLTIYDLDGMEGLYVPSSSFRETAKEVMGGALDQSMTINNSTETNNVAQWGWNAIQNAYQKTSSAISKAIKKNRAKLKYGTQVYLVNGREKQNNR